MAAKITLEVDDQTAEGFKSIVKNIEFADKETEQLSETNRQLAAAVESLQSQQSQQVAATQRQTAAIEANRRGFIEWSNTMVEFTRNMRNAAAATGEFLFEKAQWVAAKTGVDLTTAALTSLAARALGVGAPLLGAKLAAEGVGAAFDATGKKIVATEGPASAAAERLAAQINSGFKTVEQVQEQTGKSMDELGLRIESNADRIGEAWSEMSATAGTHAGRIWDAFMRPIPIVEDAWNAFTDNMEKRLGQFSRNTVENTQAITDAMNEAMGLNPDHVRSQEEFFEREEKLKEVREAYRSFENELRKQIEVRREMAEISRIATQQEVEQVRQAEREKRAELIRTGEWTKQQQERSFRRLEALTDREFAIEQEKIRKSQQAQERFAKWRQEQRQQELAEIKKNQEEAAKAREEAIEKQKSIEKEFRAGQRDLAEQRKVQLLESAKRRAEAEEKSADVIIGFEKEIAKERAKAAEAGAETEEEILRIRFDLTRRLREIDFQHKQKAEEEKAAAAEKAAQREIQAERKKIQAIKALRDEQGRNAFENIAGRQDPRKVIERIIQERQKASREQQPDLSGELRRRQDRTIRQRTLQQARRGQIDPRQVQKAQADLAARQILQAGKQGVFSQEVMKSLAEQARAFGENARLMDQLASQQEEFQQFMQQKQREARARAQRLRAQRRSNR